MHEPRLVRYADASAFLSAAGRYLAAQEAEHNLLLGICGRLRTTPHLYGSEPYFAAVLRGDEVLGAAVRTPPYNVILSLACDSSAVDAIGADVAEAFAAVPGVVGPKPESGRFAELWQGRTGQRPALALQLRVFRCGRVAPPGPVPGRLRKAVPSDRDRLVEWVTAFTAEALPAGTPRPAEEAVDDYLERGGVEGAYLWEDDDPVSFAACGNPTPRGIRVGPVYTPPELRGRGYASALVASMTQLQLDSGRTFCFLFTDLGNPTSNRIYQRIGYEPVVDVDEYHFSSE